MILNDMRIEQLAGEGLIDPFFPDKVNPASLDMTLGSDIRVIDSQFQGSISFHEGIPYRSFTMAKGKPFHLKAGCFCLAHTVEKVCIPNTLCAYVEGKSSVGRMGLIVQNAGYVDPGFEGQITLELFNCTGTTIELVPNVRICQLVFVNMIQAPRTPYQGRYQGQMGATESRVHQKPE